jgi:hypothetical protein
VEVKLIACGACLCGSSPGKGVGRIRGGRDVGSDVMVKVSWGQLLGTKIPKLEHMRV